MFGWLKKSKTEPSIGDVIAVYATLVEKHGTAILDTSMLPLPKARMKEILKAAYKQTTDAGMRGHLGVGYMFLGNFQDGVGPKPISADLPSGTSKQEMEETVRILERWKPWNDKAMAESGTLLSEWQTFEAAHK